MTDILLKQIRQYELVNPVELLVFQNIHTVQRNFKSLSVTTEQMRKTFEGAFRTKMWEMYNEEPTQQVQDELKSQHVDYDIFLSSRQKIGDYDNQSNYFGAGSVQDFQTDDRRS